MPSDKWRATDLIQQHRFSPLPAICRQRGDDPVSAMLSEQVKNQDKGGAATPLLEGQLPFPLYLSKTQKAILYVPASLTAKELDLLRKQIDHSLTIIEATILSDDNESLESQKGCAKFSPMRRPLCLRMEASGI